MSTLKIEYYADTMDDVADKLEAMAKEKRDSVRKAATKKVRAVGHAEARGLDQAARVVRRTVLNPPREGGRGGVRHG
jgi:hypothetical protein